MPKRGEVKVSFDVHADVYRVIGFDGTSWTTLGGVDRDHYDTNRGAAQHHIDKLINQFQESLHHGKHRQPNQTNNSDPSEAPSPGTPGARHASTAGKNPGASPAASPGKSLTNAELSAYLAMSAYLKNRKVSIPSVYYQSPSQYTPPPPRYHGTVTGRWASGGGGPGGAAGIVQMTEFASAPVIPHEGIQLGEIEAYRAWFLIDGKLRSMYKKTFWEPGQPMTGDISDGSGVHAWNSHDGTMMYVMEEAAMNWRSEQHDVAAYFALRNGDLLPADIKSKLNKIPPVIIGKLVLWGEVVHHALGYRAEFARPTEFLQVLDVSCRGNQWDHDRSHDILSDLRSTYLTPPTE